MLLDSFFVGSHNSSIKEPQSILRRPILPARRRKGKKRPNLFQEAMRSGIPASDLPPQTKTVQLPPVDKKSRNDNTIISDREFPYIQMDYDFLEDTEHDNRLLRKTLHALPTTVDSANDI